MENLKSYVEALDPSTSKIVTMVKKPLEGLQTAKINFLNHVATFFDVFGI